MRVLVTGATGVIGRLAVPLLRNAGHEVTAVGRSMARLEPLAQLGASTLAADLFDERAVARAVSGHEAVVNLATHIPPPGPGTFRRGAWRENDRIRTDASRILVDAARAAGALTFIQESFAPVYPDSGDRWIAEDTPLQPVRYNRSVLDAESSTARFAGEGRRGIVLRFAFFYGANDPFTRTAISSVGHGWFPVFGDADGYFSTASHDTAASAVIAALGVPSGTYNVADSEPLTRRQLGATIADAIGHRPPRVPPRWMGKLFGGIGEMLSRSLRISNQHLRSTGWNPVSAHDGWLAAIASSAR
jgi:nucleoside-diphosphate-sugar epimerase